MSDPRELLARLTAGGLPLETSIRSTVTDRLESMDLAMAAGMIEPRHAALLLAMYADDWRAEREAARYWHTDVVDQQWNKVRGNQLLSYTTSTIMEHLGRHTVCAVCQGTAERLIETQVVVCQACDGRGRVPYSPARYQLLLSCTPAEWDSVWRERVAWGQRVLRIWELDAVQALTARLRDG